MWFLWCDAGPPHLDDSGDLGVDVVVGEVEARPEGALVEQRVLVELDLPTGVPLVQAHRAVREVDHLPQDQLGSWGGGTEGLVHTHTHTHRDKQGRER